MTTNWINVARLDELPRGARKLCTVDDRRVALFNVDGAIYAIDNHCPHRDGPVGAGALAGTAVTCPWHGWRFCVKTGQCLEPGGNSLRRYAVRVAGNDVSIEIAATPGDGPLNGIYACLVRYGALGHVSRVGSNHSISCSRGDQVIINTDRGLEIGEVLEAPRSVIGSSNSRKPTGELLRVMTEEDHQRRQRLDDTQQTVLRFCQELLAARQLSVVAIDVEQLFDGQSILIHYLGDSSEKLGPIAVDLGTAFGNRHVQFVQIQSRHE